MRPYQGVDNEKDLLLIMGSCLINEWREIYTENTAWLEVPEDGNANHAVNPGRRYSTDQV